jgi:hypothetical protein
MQHGRERCRGRRRDDAGVSKHLKNLLKRSTEAPVKLVKADAVRAPPERQTLAVVRTGWLRNESAKLVEESRRRSIAASTVGGQRAVSSTRPTLKTLGALPALRSKIAR